MKTVFLEKLIEYFFPLPLMIHKLNTNFQGVLFLNFEVYTIFMSTNLKSGSFV